jgi:hypothetical protein
VHKNPKSINAQADIASQYENGSEHRSIREERTQTHGRFQLIINTTLKILEATAQSAIIPEALLLLMVGKAFKKPHHTVRATASKPKDIYL